MAKKTNWEWDVSGYVIRCHSGLFFSDFPENKEVPLDEAHVYESKGQAEANAEFRMITKYKVLPVKVKRTLEILKG